MNTQHIDFLFKLTFGESVCFNNNGFWDISGTHLDAVPNQLTPQESSLHLVDGGFAINSPFPLVLQPERDVDVIFSFNYSWQAPFEVSIINKLERNGLESSESAIPYVNIGP